MTLTAVDYTGAYDGTAHAGGATASVTDGTTIQYSTDGGTTWSATVPSITNVGTVSYQVKATNANYEDATAAGTLTVNKATMTLTAVDYSGTYDGTAHAGGATAGVTEGTTIEYSTDGGTTWTTDVPSIKDVGEVNYQVKATNANYNDSIADGKLTVNPVSITFTSKDREKTYDGGPFPVNTEPPNITGNCYDLAKLAFSYTNNSTDAGNDYSNTFTINWGSVNSDNYDVTSVFGTLTIDPAPLTITSQTDTKPYDGTPLTCHESNVVRLVDDETLKINYTGSQTNVGDSPNWYTVDWESSTAKKGNYNVTLKTGTLTVTPGTLTVEAVDYEDVYDGNAHSGGATANITEGTTIQYSTDGGTTWTATVPSITDVGTLTYQVTASNPNCGNTATDTGTLTVTKATGMTVSATNYSGAYDGTAHSGGGTASVTEGTTIQYSTNGGTTWTADAPSITNVGSLSYQVKATNVNYEDATANGTLTVTKATMTVTAVDYNGTYDGTEHLGGVMGTVPEGTAIQYSTDGGTTWTTYVPSITNVGTLSYQVKATNANYDYATANGTLTVTKATMTVTAVDYTGKYDGTPHVGGATAGVTEGTTIEYSTDGGTTWTTDVPSITNAGKLTYQVKATNANYDDVTANGTLTVDKAPLTISSYSQTCTYDGGVEAVVPVNTNAPNINGEFYEPCIYAENTAATHTDAGSWEHTFSIHWGDAKESNYDVTLNIGTLTIKPAPAIVTTGSATKSYDGTPLTNSEASITGLVGSETATVTATGSQTDVGSSPNTYTIIWGKDEWGEDYKASNYSITKNLGMLEVTEPGNSASPRMFSFGRAGSRMAAEEITEPLSEETGESADQEEQEATDPPPDESGERKEEVNTDPSAGDPGGSGDEKAEDLSDTSVIEPADTGEASEPNPAEDSSRTEQSDPSDADAAETDSPVEEPSDTGDSSEPDAAEPQPVEAADTEEETETDSAADSSQTEPADSGSRLSSGFTFAAVASGSRTETGSSDDAADDGDETEDATIAEVPAETADEPPMAEQLKLRIDLGGKTMKYDGTRGSVLKPKLTYMSGDYAGQTIDPEKISSVSGGCEAIFKLFTGDTLKLTVSGFTSCDAGVYPLHGNCKFKGGAAEYKVVDYINDTVTVTPSQLTVASLSAEKDYDGEPLVMHESYIDGLAYGETITVNYTGSQTEPGSSENTFTVSWGTARETNYVLNPIYGTLTVSDPAMSGVPKPADATPEPTPTPPGEGEGSEPEPTPTPPGDGGGEPEPTVTPPGEGEGGESEPTSAPPGEGEGGESEPTSTPPGEGEDGGSEPEPAADPPGNGDEGEEAGPPTDDQPGNGDEGEEAGPPADDPPGNGDKGEEAGPPADDAPESAGNDEKTEPALPADKPENNGGEKETPASDPFAAEPEERNSEPAQVPETSAAEPADIGGSSAPAPVPDVPKTEPAVPDPGD